MHSAPFTISIPTPLGITRGTYSPSRRPGRSCLLLVTAQEFEAQVSPSLASALRRVVAASRITGVSVLRLPYRPSDAEAEALFDVLGALKVLAAWDTSRVALVLPRGYIDVLFDDHSSEHLLDNLLIAMTSSGQLMRETLGDLRSLVELIPRLLDLVYGVAVLGRTPGYPNGEIGACIAGDLRARVTGRPDMHWMLDVPAAQDAESVQTLSDVLTRWQTTALFGSEMGWEDLRSWINALSNQARSLSVSPPSRDVNRLPADGRQAEPLAATFRLGLFWLDQQFAHILADLAKRDPQRALLARTALGEENLSHFRAYRSAARAWPYLDAIARQEWVVAFGQLPHLMAHTREGGEPVLSV